MKPSKLLCTITAFLVVAACFRAAFGYGPVRLEPLLHELSDMNFSFDPFIEFLRTATMQDFVVLFNKYSDFGQLSFAEWGDFLKEYLVASFDLSTCGIKLLVSIFMNFVDLIVWIFKFLGAIFGFYTDLPDAWRGGR